MSGLTCTQYRSWRRMVVNWPREDIFVNIRRVSSITRDLTDYFDELRIETIGWGDECANIANVAIDPIKRVVYTCGPIPDTVNLRFDERQPKRVDGARCTCGSSSVVYFVSTDKLTICIDCDVVRVVNKQQKEG